MVMEQYKDRDWLYGMYWVKKLSACDISKTYGMGSTTIYRWMEKFNIPRRDTTDAINSSGSNKKYLVNESTFESCDTPEKAYWLGFIMADGCVRNKGKEYALVIELKLGDKNHLEKFNKFLNSDVPIREYSRIKNLRKHKTATIQISRKKIVEDLGKYGIIPRKTGREQIKNIPPKYYPDFIRGYFDGDGSFRKGKRGNRFAFSIACASKLFLEQIQSILIKNCDLSKTKISEYSAPCYKLNHGSKKQIPRIFNYLLQNSDIKLERKYKSLMEI